MLTWQVSSLFPLHPTVDSERQRRKGGSLQMLRVLADQEGPSSPFHSSGEELIRAVGHSTTIVSMPASLNHTLQASLRDASPLPWIPTTSNVPILRNVVGPAPVGARRSPNDLPICKSWQLPVHPPWRPSTPFLSASPSSRQFHPKASSPSILSPALALEHTRYYQLLCPSEYLHFQAWSHN